MRQKDESLRVTEVKDIPGGPVFKTAFQCSGYESDPWSGS